MMIELRGRTSLLTWKAKVEYVAVVVVVVVEEPGIMCDEDHWREKKPTEDHKDLPRWPGAVALSLSANETLITNRPKAKIQCRCFSVLRWSMQCLGCGESK